jgi:ribose transport system ATP-binding protein
VTEIADRFTVLRDGKTVGTGDVREATVHDLVTRMTGSAPSPVSPRSSPVSGDVALACDGLAGAVRPVRVSLELRRGEVVGVAGLVGSGRTELLRVLFGLDPMTGGSVQVLGRSGAASPAERIAQGLGMLSEDRKAEGLALTMSVADNLTLSKLTRLVWASWQRGVAARWVQALAIRCRDVEQPVVDLSGGNQQKVALGRLLHQDAAVLLLDQPTRGIDVAAKADVHRVTRRLAAEGKAVLFVSDDLAELCGVCDTIAVMNRGVLGPARPASEWTEASLLAAAVAAAPQAGAT